MSKEIELRIQGILKRNTDRKVNNLIPEDVRQLNIISKEVKELNAEVERLKGYKEGYNDLASKYDEVLGFFEKSQLENGKLRERVKELEESIQYIINCDQRERFKCEMPNAIFKATELLTTK